MKKKFWGIVVVIALVIVFAVVFIQGTKDSFGRGCMKELVVNGKRIFVCIADTSDERKQGLSNTSYLVKGKGLLFVFDEAGIYDFWMKDMNYPIDIIWFDEQMNEVYRKENALPSDYPNTYGSKIPAKYVLEVNPGEIPK